MNVSNDIYSLFKYFGGSAEQYQEISRQDEECEVRARWPVVAAIDPVPEPCVAQAILPAVQAPEPTPVDAAALHSGGRPRELLTEQPLEGRSEDEPDLRVERSRPPLDHIKVMAVVSAKGGVGKTTLVANLAAALQRIGQPVLALDLDPQNALHHHFQPSAGAWLAATPAGVAQFERDWRTLGVSSDTGVVVLPHGLMDERRRHDFERGLDDDPLWLARHLHDLRLAAGTVVIIDTPAGPSPYLRQALAVARVALVVSLADAASYTALPMIDRLVDGYAAGRDDFAGKAYLINQLDNARQLNKDIAQIMRRRLGEQVIGAIHSDQSITEALAHGRSVLDYDPHGRGCHDILHCARALIGRLAAGVRNEQPA